MTLAKGLSARVVTANANVGADIDMMALWPNDQNPTYLIACNEQDTTDPGLQRSRLLDGQVETILSGTSCDPVRAHGVGHDSRGRGSRRPAGDRDHPAPGDDRGGLRPPTGTRRRHGAGNLAGAPCGRTLAFEGLALYPNGVLYYGDESGPPGHAGGAYFKFIPSTPWTGGTITDLSQSPLVSGKVYGLRLGKRSGNTDYGQGSKPASAPGCRDASTTPTSEPLAANSS